MEKVIQVKNLVKKYGSFTAVNGVTFEVKKGEIFGLLGENGAGKTTTLEMIEGLRTPTAGEIKVLGFDVRHEIAKIKQRIGVQLQSSAYYRFLTLREILDLFASFYEKSLDPDDLLKMVGLEQKANSLITNLSGGQRQRFSIIASLINDPEIVFLDEPTTGLDPIARRHLWEIISDIKKQGKTIILTTHYMEEAEVLCDRVAIMEKGNIIAMDETHRLIEKVEYPYKVDFIAKKVKESELGKLEKLGELKSVAGKSYRHQLMIKTAPKLNDALGILHELETESLTVGRSSLEDVFIELTGKKIEGDENA